MPQSRKDRTGTVATLSRRPLIYGLSTLCALLFNFSVSANVSEYKMENGLTLLVKEDHRAPVVVSQVWYRVGSSYEYNGITGVSHVLEHMMFKGTDHLKPGESSHIIAENGGDENAFTGYDYTAYFQKLEKSRLPVSFHLEADRMRNLKLLNEEFEKEVQVVMEERRLRTEDNPQSLTHEQFRAASFFSSPYHHPIIGWMDDLKHLELNDLSHWYKRWYSPSNATVVVVGDVNPEEVHQLALSTFGQLESEQLAPPKPQREIEQIGKREIVVKAPAKLPYLIMGYKVPSAVTAENDWEPFALEVLINILDGGKSARFENEIIRGEQIASSLGTGYSMLSRLDTQLYFSGTPSEGSTVEDLKTAIFKQLEKIKAKPVSANELERVKTQVIARSVYERDSIFYQAMLLGTLATVGLDWRLADQYVDKIKAVTIEQVQDVAKKYLQEDRLTVATLDPQPLDRQPARPRVPLSGRH